MCGIFGYLGKRNALQACLKGLKLLEYRGYDSAGIAAIVGKDLVITKSSGKVAELEKRLIIQESECAIAHTRWATHGRPNEVNAHPHIDHKEQFALVHNGVIENYDHLRSELLKKGYRFTSETDSEVIVQLISSFFEGDLLDAFASALRLLKGSFALALIYKGAPNEILVAAKESPLVIGYNTEESIISSDPNAFAGMRVSALFLKNNEIAKITPGSTEVYDLDLTPLQKKEELIDGGEEHYSKGDFAHYMLKEIHEQPLSVGRAIMGRYSEEFGTAEFEGLNFSSSELLATKHILFLACGTSLHAGMLAAELLEELARIPTQAEIASEIRYKNPIISDETLVIALSQSGETADTIAAMREAKAKGAKVLAICNVRNSTLVRESHSAILLKAGPEISVCSTKAFTSQLSVLTLFALHMARLRHLDKDMGKKLLHHLQKIPNLIRIVLQQSEEIKKAAKKYSSFQNFFFIGRKYMYVAALEAALKFKEISYINSCAYPAGELKHGSIALVDENFPVVAFCANEQTIDKMISNIMEVKARGAPVLAFAPVRHKELANIVDDLILLPDTIDELASFPSAVAGQLFAYFVALERGSDIDQPRNLAKSVTVE